MLSCWVIISHVYYALLGLCWFCSRYCIGDSWCQKWNARKMQETDFRNVPHWHFVNLRFWFIKSKPLKGVVHFQISNLFQTWQSDMLRISLLHLWSLYYIQHLWWLLLCLVERQTRWFFLYVYIHCMTYQYVQEISAVLGLLAACPTGYQMCVGWGMPLPDRLIDSSIPRAHICLLSANVACLRKFIFNAVNDCCI